MQTEKIALDQAFIDAEIIALETQFNQAGELPVKPEMGNDMVEEQFQANLLELDAIPAEVREAAARDDKIPKSQLSSDAMHRKV